MKEVKHWTKILNITKFGGVVQLVRTVVSKTACCGFESCHLRHFYKKVFHKIPFCKKHYYNAYCFTNYKNLKEFNLCLRKKRKKTSMEPRVFRSWKILKRFAKDRECILVPLMNKVDIT